MFRFSVPAPEFSRLLVQVVKSADDREDAEVRLTLDSRSLEIAALDGGASAEIPITAREQATHERTSWIVRAGALRDAVRTSRGGVSSGEAQFTLSPSSSRSVIRAFATGRPRSAAVAVQPVPAEAPTAPAKLHTIPLAPRDFKALSEFIGLDGTLTFDLERGAARAVAPDGGTMECPLDVQDPKALRALARVLGRVSVDMQPDRRVLWLEAQIEQIDETLGREKRRENAREVTSFYRTERDRLQERLDEIRNVPLPTHVADPFVTLDGRSVQQMAFALASEDGRVGAEARAENKRLGIAGTPEAEARLAQLEPRISLSASSGSGLRTFGTGGLRATCVEHATPDEAREPLAMENSVEIQAQALRALVEEADRAEMPARLAATDAPRAFVVFQPSGKKEMTVGVFSPNSDPDSAEQFQARVERVACHSAAQTFGLAAAVDVRQFMKLGGYKSRLRISADSERRLLARISNYTYRLPLHVDPDRDAWTAAARHTHDREVRRAWAYAEQPKSDQIAELYAEEVGRGTEPPSRVWTAAPARGQRRATPFANELLDRFNVEADQHLAARLTPDDVADLAVRAQAGDDAARDRLILSNLAWATAMADEAASAIPFEDRLSIAHFAIVRAADTWKQDGNGTFQTWSKRIFRNRLSDELSAVGGYQISFWEGSVLREVGEVRRQIMDELGTSASSQIVAERMADGVTDPEERLKIYRYVEIICRTIESSHAVSLSRHMLEGRRTYEQVLPAEVPEPEFEGRDWREIETLRGTQQPMLVALTGYGNAFRLSRAEFAAYVGASYDTAQARVNEAVVSLDAARQTAASRVPAHRR